MPVHQSCASFKTVYMLCIPAFFRTSLSEIWSCHLILTAFSNSLNGNGEVSLHDVGILTRSHMHTRGLAASQPCRLSAWSQAYMCIPFSCTCIFSRQRIHESVHIDGLSIEKGTSRQSQENVQSERDSHSKNRGGKKTN